MSLTTAPHRLWPAVPCKCQSARCCKLNHLKALTAIVVLQLQKLALAQLLNHVATTRGIGSMALCALWHGGLTHARGSGVWQFMHPQGGTFVDSDACDLWAPPQLARALVRLRACTPAGRQPGSSAVAPSLCCGPLLVPGRHACFEGPWSEEPDPKRQKI